MKISEIKIFKPWQKLLQQS